MCHEAARRMTSTFEMTEAKEQMTPKPAPVVVKKTGNIFKTGGGVQSAAAKRCWLGKKGPDPLLGGGGSSPAGFQLDLDDAHKLMQTLISSWVGN